MRILGISAFYHDSAAALIDDGHIVAAAQEERFTRKKHDSGFPEAAIAYCLDEAGVGLGDVEGVETGDVMSILGAYGIDEMQGYYYGRPLGADAIAEFMAGAVASSNHAAKSA